MQYVMRVMPPIPLRVYKIKKMSLKSNLKSQNKFKNPIF
ncbi:hypothetical protein HPHPP23_0346 [Helicobacter pylori Hp P-23]|uniref:Uncharacterized protein n=1 Tax=Helicobacter pylori Hp P-15 TaxID=992080 RepID=J0QCC4_HELPX|nr:hypothetical protein HPHPH27_0414 [Helicobacter pylori Hp H-27]EJB61471.1 hypothetical protein HPHPH36_0318 [Helicobacter pylori Hp H-36]EJC08456.1 hypothetical protein HPHPP15_0418 [Helicobacter pylori Hp P-15]EJC13928.1 hypothetical protein HPHPP23_0346 [Helicobacter pylori Hp P-23]EJC33044.1 hypothetical protein HPHPP15B_0419 [Helicobacter pylori Hp P-15b]